MSIPAHTVVTKTKTKKSIHCRHALELNETLGLGFLVKVSCLNVILKLHFLHAPEDSASHAS